MSRSEKSIHDMFELPTKTDKATDRDRDHDGDRNKTMRIFEILSQIFNNVCTQVSPTYISSFYEEEKDD